MGLKRLTTVSGRCDVDVTVGEYAIAPLN
jgi:hypothetical protein